MPLLFKSKKDLVKSFQYGGSTNFYATAGFKPTQRPIYNPGALLQVYAPKIPAAATSLPKEDKSILKLDFEGKGHNNDESAAIDIMKQKYDNYKNAVAHNMNPDYLNTLESDMMFTQRSLNNSKNNSLELTKEAKKEAFDNNKASGNLIFKDGNFFGTLSKKNKDGKWESIDTEIPADEYYSLISDNKTKDNNAINTYFVPETYNQAFNKRHNSNSQEYMFSNGDKIVSTILQQGMGNEKALIELNNIFAGLGEEKKAQVVSSAKKANGILEATTSQESYADNLKNLKASGALIDKFVDPKIKSAVERQAWLNMPSSVFEKAKNLEPQQKKQLFKIEADKQYWNIISDMLDIRKKTSESEGTTVKDMIDRLPKEGSGSGSEKSTPEAGPVLDILVGDPKDNFLETLVINKDDLKKSSLSIKLPSNWALLNPIVVEKITQENEADSQLDPDKNIASSLKVQKAISATKIKNEKLLEARSRDKGTGYLSLSDLSLGETAFSNVSEAQTLNNVNIGKYADNISVSESGDVNITWMPFEKESGRFLLSGEDKDKTKELSEAIQIYNKTIAEAKRRFQLPDKDPQKISANRFGEIIDENDSDFTSRFKDYKMKPFHQLKVGIDIPAIVKDEREKERLLKVASPELDSNSFIEGSTMYNYNKSLNGGFFNFSDNDDIRYIDVFIPIPHIAQLREIAGKNVYTPDAFISSLNTDDYKYLRAAEFKPTTK